MTSWFVYMIRCADNSLYTGSTNHVIKRWHKHCSGNGARYTKAHTPEMLVHIEEHPDRSAACKREYRIKQFTKEEKEELVRES